MIHSGPGVLKGSEMFFSTPSLTAKKMYYYPVSMGHCFCDGNYRISRDSLDSLLIMHLLSGELFINTDGKSFHAHKDDTAIIDCRVPHEYYASEFCEFLWIHISGDNSLEFYRMITKDEGNVLRPSDPDHVRRLLFRLIGSSVAGNYLSEINTSLDIYKLFAELLNPLRPSASSERAYDELIQQAKDFIYEHLDEKLSVGDIAASVHMSSSHFSRAFKQQTGFSPYEFVLMARLNKAKGYLQKSDLTVTEIAYKVGFNSDTNFIYFFTQNTGLSPNKFRKLQF